MIWTEPNQKTKFVLEDFSNDETYWFETAEEAGNYLTEKRLVDPDGYVVYELGKEVKFKLVPTSLVKDQTSRDEVIKNE